MNKFLAIDVSDNEWSKVVNQCETYDFYHTQSYHLLEKENTPVLFTLCSESEVIALPLIIRKIPNSDLFDCTSAYGYCGPISSVSLDVISNNLIINFQKELINYFDKNNIIAVFSRLHPLISHGTFFGNFGTIKNLNKTISIDLGLSPDEQRKQYRRSNKSELNQLRRKGFTVVEATSKESIDEFVSIYHETMERVEATESYFFDNEYFYTFLQSSNFEAKLLLANFEGKIIAGAVFTISNKIMQYHLAGTTQDFIKVTPMKLIIDEARLLGNKLHLEYLHLGGGVGGSDDDSLFRFKAGFSDCHNQYQVWEMIVNEVKYQELVIKNNSNKYSNFFPLYRS